VSRTPALSAAISDALLAGHVQEEYLTSRINWAVQSSGVDYLHMLLTGMVYLCRRYRIDARLLLTIHDEVRYCVAEGDALRAALALQVANLWTRAMFVHRLGMAELPLSVAFFGAVDVDAVLRKEPTADCVTPSSPAAVPPGQSLDIHALLGEVRDLGCPLDGVLPPAMRRMQHIPASGGADALPVGQLVEFLRLQAGLTTATATAKRAAKDPQPAPSDKPGPVAESAAVERGLKAWRTVTTKTKG
jgi:DNA polymerase gamma 1